MKIRSIRKLDWQKDRIISFKLILISIFFSLVFKYPFKARRLHIFKCGGQLFIIVILLFMRFDNVMIECIDDIKIIDQYCYALNGIPNDLVVASHQSL